jgi:DNA-binding LacI/PurR family transcriptional regulator
MSVQEIAKRAGVSTATVSRVLNRSNLVRPKTRERVEAVIAEL